MDGEIVVNIREEKKVRRFFKRVIEVSHHVEGFTFNMRTWSFVQGYSGINLSEFDMFSDEKYKIPRGLKTCYA